ncbi:MAG: cytochrome c maturation protein CcmE [Chloroflexi bacterium]|nr:cytochrome c maturation protein CcmE [Chloroflexota bacterium]
MLKKKKFWIAGVVLAIAMGALVYNSVAGSSVYYYTVNELKAQPVSPDGQDVRVNGIVTTGPIEWNAQARTTSFTMQDKDGAETLFVVYQGTVPDAFKADVEVVVRGKLDSKGVFRANELLAKCASKYTPK